MELLILLLFSPLILIFVGLIMLISAKTDADRSRGKRFLLAGFISLGVFILIGYAVCSGGIGGGGGFH